MPTTKIKMEDPVSLVFEVEGKEYRVDPFVAIEWIEEIAAPFSKGSKKWLDLLPKGMHDNLGMPMVNRPQAIQFYLGVREALNASGAGLKKNTGEQPESPTSTESTPADGLQPSNGRSASTSPDSEPSEP